MSYSTTQPTPLDTEDGVRPRWFLTVAMRADKPRSLPMRVCLDDTDEVRIVRGDALAAVRDAAAPRSLTIRIDDGSLSSQHVRMIRGEAGWSVEDAGSRNGTLIDARRLGSGECYALHDGAVIECGQTFLVFRAHHAQVAADTVHARERAQVLPKGLVTMNPALEDSFAALERVTRSPLPVLIRGETGTGKELVAHAVHQLSQRTGPMVAINCASIPSDLLHAELFGARRGSYSGATADREGMVRAADGGTVFFDEIAELAPASQVTLLRLLQEHEVIPLGGTRAIAVDVRFVAATHADVHAIGFRTDLLGRLSGFVIKLPPLRDRREDIGLLIAAFLDECGADPELSFSLAAARKVMCGDWRLNIRQLRHAITAAVLSGDRRLEGERFRFDDTYDRAAASLAPAARPVAPASGVRGRVGADELGELLRLHRGNLSAVARALITSRTQVTRLMRRFNLDASGSQIANGSVPLTADPERPPSRP